MATVIAASKITWRHRWVEPRCVVHITHIARRRLRPWWCGCGCGCGWWWWCIGGLVFPVTASISTFGDFYEKFKWLIFDEKYWKFEFGGIFVPLAWGLILAPSMVRFLLVSIVSVTVLLPLIVVMRTFSITILSRAIVSIAGVTLRSIVSIARYPLRSIIFIARVASFFCPRIATVLTLLWCSSNLPEQN